MTDRCIDVFFYGLFMDRTLLESKGARPSDERQGLVRGFSIRIGQRATLVRDDEGTAHGVVMCMSRRELDMLYADASLTAYRPEAVLVDLSDGSAVPALCYNLLETPASHERNEEYAAKLRALAERVGLPADYISQIR